MSGDRPVTAAEMRRSLDAEKIAALRARIRELERSIEIFGAMIGRPQCPACGEFLCRRTTFKGKPAYCEKCGRDVPQPAATDGA